MRSKSYEKWARYDKARYDETHSNLNAPKMHTLQNVSQQMAKTNNLQFTCIFIHINGYQNIKIAIKFF